MQNLWNIFPTKLVEVKILIMTERETEREMTVLL